MIGIKIVAVGRLRAGPELALVEDYLGRAEKAGRALGIGPVSVTEVEDRRGGGKSGEADLISAATPPAAYVCALDERGREMGSPEFSNKIAGLRDDGCPTICFLIGGADGLDPKLRARADMALSFGKMVWPHMLARVMLAEQIYRAVTIMSGSPYHRV